MNQSNNYSIFGAGTGAGAGAGKGAGVGAGVGAGAGVGVGAGAGAGFIDVEDMSLGEATFDTAGDKRGLGDAGVTEEEGVGLAGLRGIREDGLAEGEEGAGCGVCLGEEGVVND